MSTTVLRATLAEATGRRVVLWGLVASAAYLAVFGVGFSLLYREIASQTLQSTVTTVATGGILTILGLYVASFLAAFLALIMAASSVSSDVDAGVTQAVLVRPLTRTSWYLQRWAALVGLACGYVVVMAGAVLLIAGVVSSYRPVSAGALLGLLVLEMTCLVTVGMLASTRLPTIAAGVLLFSWFGLSWMGGFLSFIGALAGKPTLVDVATAVSLLAPSDGLWKGASNYAAPAGIDMAAFTRGGELPFAAFSPPTGAFLAWTALFTLVALIAGIASFRRRDV